MLEMRYRRSGDMEARPRAVAPLGLVLKAGIWYLVAQRGKTIRTYRVANIHDARISEETFIRPKAFDLAVHWQQASRDYEAGVYHERADVRLSPRGMSMLDLLGPYVARAATETASKPDRSGWVRCTLPLESFDFGVREMMRLGAEVNVLGPPPLRALIARNARQIAAAHANRRSSRAR